MLILKRGPFSGVEQFFPSANTKPAFVRRANITTMILTMSALKEYMPKKLQDFSKRWFEDPAFKDLVSNSCLISSKEISAR